MLFAIDGAKLLEILEDCQAYPENLEFSFYDKTLRVSADDGEQTCWGDLSYVATINLPPLGYFGLLLRVFRFRQELRKYLAISNDMRGKLMNWLIRHFNLLSEYSLRFIFDVDNSVWIQIGLKWAFQP